MGAVVTSMSGNGNLDRLSATEPRDHRSFQVCMVKIITLPFVKVWQLVEKYHLLAGQCEIHSRQSKLRELDLKSADVFQKEQFN